MKRLIYCRNNAAIITDEELVKIAEEAADAIEELSREIDIDNAAMTAMDAAMPRWISVAERLPEANGYYLTYVESALFPNSYYFNMIKFIDGEFIEDHCVIHRVTHWMPLPEPPEEKT